MALFCHGGVWAHGERWHYAPMAARLAQAGVLTLVMSYSLYPKASASMQTAEVNDALNWSLSNAGKYGGNPDEVKAGSIVRHLRHCVRAPGTLLSPSCCRCTQVSLVGHSAGAHLCAMALLHRAAASSRKLTAADGQIPLQDKMPAAFVGIAGVYDISQHYDYERRRGVEVWSTAYG